MEHSTVSVLRQRITQFFGQFQPNHPNTAYLTGLRAYAAFGVFLIHSGGGGLRELGVIGNNLVDFGKWGVLAFYFLSAFTICLALERQKGAFSYVHYLSKRVLRIIPLYWSVCLFDFLTDTKHPMNWYNLFAHMSLINLFDMRFRDTFLGVEWSIPVEFGYYLLIPFLFYFFVRKNLWVHLGIVLTGLLITVLSFKPVLLLPYIGVNIFPIDEPHTALGAHMSLERYAFAYALAIFTHVHAARLQRLLPQWLSLGPWLLLGFGLIFLPYQPLSLVFPVWFSVLMVLLMNRPSRLRSMIFEAPLVLMTGEISYSIYLLHLYGLQIWKGSLTGPMYVVMGFATTFLLAMITYYVIEKPFLKLKGLSLASGVGIQPVKQTLG